MNHVRFETDASVCIVTIDRPHQRNAVDGETAAALRAAFERFEADDALRVAILTGAGGHFCGGADLAAIGDPARRNAFEVNGGGSGPMGPTRMALSKPLIAAVNGYAVAGGLELALLADLRVADEDAVFGVFCRRWGVPLIDGGTVRLPRLVGMGRALDLILTGRPVGAREAEAMGLVNRVVPNGGALAAAIVLAREIAAFPQQCMLADRRSAHEQWDLPLAEALRREGVNGVPIVVAEGEAGAARFAAGAGRHGKFETGDRIAVGASQRVIFRAAGKTNSIRRQTCPRAASRRSAPESSASRPRRSVPRRSRRPRTSSSSASCRSASARTVRPASASSAG